MNNERDSLERRRNLLKTVAHDAKGPTRRSNISQLSSGTGGGNIPRYDGQKPQTAQYNTARGSFFNQRFQNQLGASRPTQPTNNNAFSGNGLNEMFDTSLIESNNASLFDTNRPVLNGDAPSIFQYLQNGMNMPGVGQNSMIE